MRRFIPFGDFRPDAGILLSDAVAETNGVFPGGDRYRPMPSMNIRSATMGTATLATNRGHVNVNPPSGSPKIYILNGSSVRVVDTGGGPPWTVSTLAHAGTGSVGTSADAGDIIGFGQNEIFTQGHTNYAKLRLNGAGDLLDLITTPSTALGNAPRPKFGCVLGERILIANCSNLVNAGVGTPDTNPDFMWWSKTRDARTFNTSEVDRSGYAFLYDDNGPIMGLAGDREYALIFKRRAIYRMDVGGEFGFTWRVVPQSYGTISHQSIGRLGNDVYFWSDAGPCVYRSNQVVALASGRLIGYLAGFSAADPGSTIDAILGCSVDPVNQAVSWLYRYHPSGESQRVRLLSYCARTDCFAVAFDVGSVPPSYSLDLYAEDGTVGGSGAGPTLLFGGLPMAAQPAMTGAVCMLEIASTTPDETYLVTFGEAAGSSSRWIDGSDVLLRTGAYALGGELAAVVKAVRPIVRSRTAGSIGELKVKVLERTTPWGTVTTAGPYTFATDSKKNGFITTPGCSDAQFHQIELIVPAIGSTLTYAQDLIEIEGVEVEFEVKGRP